MYDHGLFTDALANSATTAQLACTFCDAGLACDESAETARFPSNVRAFRTERFTVLRCSRCGSIHAQDDVDLAHYYARYPFHKLKLDLPIRITYRSILKRLRSGGLQRDHSILDYGCGSGVLVQYLQRKGYDRTVGFDAYSREFDDRKLLERKYDCLIAQDLLEHVDDPAETLAEFSRLVKPGGIISIGTPNADGIDLTTVERHIHYLHQPYHRHIASKEAMMHLSQRLGWSLVCYFPTAYANTLLPGLNVLTWMQYSRMKDNTLDLLFEPIHWDVRMLSPRTILAVFFGGFCCPEVDVTYIFKNSGEG